MSTLLQLDEFPHSFKVRIVIPSIIFVFITVSSRCRNMHISRYAWKIGKLANTHEVENVLEKDRAICMILYIIHEF